MKRIPCLIFILLASCIPAPASPSQATTYLSPIPIGPSFTYNQECPHVCWLGINPGITTTEEALVLLNSSSQIDQDSYVKHVGEIIVEWHAGNIPTFPIRVYIFIENGVAKKLSFTMNGLVKVQELIELLGEPDEISVMKVEGAELTYVVYVVYYTSAKAFIFISTRNESGPNLENSVEFFDLNTAFDDPGLPNWLLQHYNLRQPWLGFGHLEEYLKNRPLPSE